MIERGFATIEGVFSAAECDALIAALAPFVDRGRAGARNLMSHPSVAGAARDPRLLEIVRDALGQDAVPYRATLFDKSDVANWRVAWHQDTALPISQRFEADGWGPWSIKAGVFYAHAPTWALERVLALRLYLDASISETGPLRVIPGSHRRGVLSADEAIRSGHEQTPVACVCGRGGIVAMRPLLVHSSQKAASPAPRRVLHIEYTESLDLAPGITLGLA